MDLQEMIQETFPLYEDMNDMEVAQTIWRRRGAEILGERLKQQLIESAVEWINDNYYEYLRPISYYDQLQDSIDINAFVNDFKKYAEEEL